MCVCVYVCVCVCVCVCVFVRDNLENGWMDFDNCFYSNTMDPDWDMDYMDFWKMDWKLLKSGKNRIKTSQNGRFSL